jgi:hypothetical protein
MKNILIERKHTVLLGTVSLKKEGKLKDYYRGFCDGRQFEK